MIREMLFSVALAAMAPAAAQDVTVLSTRNLPAGHQMQVVRDAQGREFRHLVKPNASEAVKQQPMREADGTRVRTYYEGFEGYYTRFGLDWIPLDWSRKDLEENIPTDEQLEHNINMRWYVYNSSNMYQDMTTDGLSEAFIHFGYIDEDRGLTGADQDEWIITPEIDLSEQETLHFIYQADFFDVYDCDDFNWGTLVYPKRIVVNTLQAMITTDGGENWTCLWDLATDVTSKLTDKQCYDLSDIHLENCDVDLSAYAGKKVQIGFRYIRKKKGTSWTGNSMIVDGIVIDHPSPAGINGVKADDAAADQYFTTDGVRLGAKPSKHGVYVKRNGKGAAKVAL